MELVMAQPQGIQAISEAFTFDDVLLKPGLSDILPSDACGSGARRSSTWWRSSISRLSRSRCRS
jgi:hypothetical protein